MELYKVSSYLKIKKLLEDSIKLFPEDDQIKFGNIEEYSKKISIKAECYAVKKEKDLGYIIFYANGEAGPNIYVTSLVIFPERCKGMEKGYVLFEFMKLLYQQANERKWDLVIFEVSKYNRSAYNLYLKFGAEVSEERENCYLMHLTKDNYENKFLKYHKNEG